MYIIRIFIVLMTLIVLNQSYADIPMPILRTCVDNKPFNDSIKITELTRGGVSQIEEPTCQNQYNISSNDQRFGIVTCNDVFYLIINGKKIKATSAINRSQNPEVSPGLPFSIHSFWSKIEQNNDLYLCIEATLTDSGIGSSVGQYYIVENAFSSKTQPTLYYYFFNKEIIPITSPHF